jgi:hypothetical protein
MTVFALDTRRGNTSRRKGENSKWVACLEIKDVERELLAWTCRASVDRQKRASTHDSLPVCEFKVPARACAISLPNRLKHSTFGITDLDSCLRKRRKVSVLSPGRLSNQLSAAFIGVNSTNHVQVFVHYVETAPSRLFSSMLRDRRNEDRRFTLLPSTASPRCHQRSAWGSRL